VVARGVGVDDGALDALAQVVRLAVGDDPAVLELGERGQAGALGDDVEVGDEPPAFRVDDEAAARGSGLAVADDGDVSGPGGRDDDADDEDEDDD